MYQDFRELVLLVPFSIYIAQYYVPKRKNLQVAWFNLVHVALFAGNAFLLMLYLGMIGYGWAEIFALASCFILHLYTIREVGSLNYTEALI